MEELSKMDWKAGICCALLDLCEFWHEKSMIMMQPIVGSLVIIFNEVGLFSY